MIYCVVTTPKLEELELVVTQLLHEGWKPLGGIAVAQSDFYSENRDGDARDNFSQVWAQAMVHMYQAPGPRAARKRGMSYLRHAAGNA